MSAAPMSSIMLIATSLYSGAREADVSFWFQWLMFALFLPVLLYAAVPFYRSAWSALKSRHSSIDVPIAAAVLIGSAIGLYHLLIGEGDLYFDSLAVLVFLLLSSRYLLFKLQHKFLAPTHLSAFFEASRVRGTML